MAALGTVLQRSPKSSMGKFTRDLYSRVLGRGLVLKYGSPHGEAGTVFPSLASERACDLLQPIE